MSFTRQRHGRKDLGKRLSLPRNSRIEEQTVLAIAIARVSYWLEIKRQLPFLFFWSKSTSNPLLKKCERTLLRSDMFIDGTDQ